MLRMMITRAGLSAALVASFCSSATADPVADFYHGKQISMIVSTPAGGGYDVYARFLARYMGRYIPGNPTFVVRNMPGAGGIIAANYLAVIAPPDGLTMEIISSTITHKQLGHAGGARFDVREFNWIGNMSIASSICALGGPAAKLSGDDLFKTEVIVGGTAGLPTVAPLILNALAGTHFKVIEGYAGTPQLLQAIETGEINGLCGWGWDSARVIGRELFARGIAAVKLDVAVEPHPELQAMHVPFIMDFVPEGPKKEALKLILSTQLYNRAFAVSGGVPAERVAALREAFTATLQDPEAKAEANQLGLEIRYLAPAAIAKVVQSEFAAPAEVQKLALDELKKAGF